MCIRDSLFFAMTMFAGMHPDSLGWGPVTLQSSFGLLRFAFFLVSIFASLLVASFFDLWHTDNVVEAWAEFTQTDLFTAKKALYLCLMVQMVRRGHRRAPSAAAARSPPRARLAGSLPAVHGRGGGLGAAAHHHLRLLPRRQEEELHAHVRCLSLIHISEPTRPY